MLYVKNLINKGDQLIRNTSWMLASEGVSKISRIATVIALAAFLSPADYGVAALTLMLHELFRVFTRAGSGALVIQCTSEVLEKTAVAAWVQQWLLCLIMIAVQYFSAPLLAQYYNKPILESLLQITAFTYLLYPIVSVRVFLLQRKNAFRHVAIGSALSITADNFGTVIFLICDASVYAVALAKMLAAITWLAVFIRHENPFSIKSFHWLTFCRLATFSFKVFISELLKVGRFQIDILIAGKLLSPELFGFYSFAKNAGIGLGQSLSNAYLAGLSPYLAEQFRSNNHTKAAKRALNTSAFLCAIFLLQALAAPIYLQILFTDQWSEAATLVSLLCLSAIPALLLDTQGTVFRINNSPAKEAALMTCCVASHFVLLVLLARATPLTMASTVLASSASWLIWIAVFHAPLLNIIQNPVAEAAK